MIRCLIGPNGHLFLDFGDSLSSVHTHTVSVHCATLNNHLPLNPFLCPQEMEKDKQNAEMWEQYFKKAARVCFIISENHWRKPLVHYIVL